MKLGSSPGLSAEELPKAWDKGLGLMQDTVVLAVE
jgi:hypothetical protein